MPISVLARGADARGPAAHAAVQAAFDDLRAVDALFSTYRDDSAVSRLNRGDIALADCPEQVQEVAELCGITRDLTRGLFDAVHPDGTWDPSGLVKGWAAEGALTKLTRAARLDWCLNCGGDVAVSSESGDPFVIGVADPADNTRVLTTVTRATGAVATSGMAARGAHLYDPRTGTPASEIWSSMTVTGPSLAIADVWATAAFVAGGEWFDLLACAPDYAALAVGPDGIAQTTANWVEHGGALATSATQRP